MHDSSLCKVKLVQTVLALLCISGNALGRRDSRSLELQGVVQSGNLFAEDVYRVLTQPGNDEFTPTFENKNVIMSPLSINIALAMLMAGTTGNTEQEILQALHLGKDMKEPAIHKGFHDLITTLRDNSNDEGVQLHLANRIYVGQLYTIKPSFLHTIRHQFFADAEQVNFGEMEKTADTVNKWVREATKDRIKQIVQPSMLNNQTLMILVNAIHFRGEWKHSFNPDYTSDSTFTTISGNEVPVSMMRLERPRRFNYARLPDLKASAVALPYSSQRYNLVVILPEKGHSLNETEAKLQDGTLASIPSRMRSTPVDVRMPKIVLNSEVDLIGTKVVENLGMSSMTTQLAEFDKLTEEKGAHITNIIHKGVLDINEAGSEAAAATAFVAQARSLDLDPVTAIKFVVDRPFIAYIYDSQTKSVLFIARKIM